MKRGLKILIGAAVAVVVLAIGGWILYATVINDPEDELTTQDLDERLQDTTVPASSDPGAPVSTDAPTTSEGPASTDAPAGGPAASSPDGVDGTWVVAAGTEVGYRVEETLSGIATTAVGRTSQVEGSIVIAGTEVTEASFTVDVASIASDSSRRDGQFRGPVMETDVFPTASLVLTEPIELGQVPAAGEQVTATATGELTLHGVTRSVTFEVTAQQENGKVGILGQIPVLFADYDIDNPSFGPVETDDDGLLEVLLVLEPA